MFKHFSNIDSAFKYVKGLTVCVIIGCLSLCGFALYKSYSFVASTQAHIYILANGKALEEIGRAHV